MPVAANSPTSAPDPLATDGLLQSLLEVSLTGALLLCPLYGPDGGEPVDFAIAYLNPAGQRMVGLPANPQTTLLTHFPHTEAGRLNAL